MVTRMCVNRLIVVLFCALMGACAGASRAESPAACTVLPVEASVMRIGVEHKLTITVKNIASTQIELEEFYFGANMLHLRATTKPDARDLRQVIPLLAPGVETVKIGPGQKIIRETELDVIFPDLQSSLNKSDVEVSWEVIVNPNNGCFYERVAASVTLKKNEEGSE